MNHQIIIQPTNKSLISIRRFFLKTQTTIILCVITAGAGWMDWRTGKVKNEWIFLGGILGILLRGWKFFPGAVLFLFTGFLMFLFRMMGAGDGKLMALIGGYLGVWQGLCAVGLGFCTASVWSVWKLARAGPVGKELSRRFLRLFWYTQKFFQTGERSPYIKFEEMKEEEKIPLGTCLAIGVFIFFLIGFFNQFFEQSVR